MLAVVTTPDGRPFTLHRTYLTPDGRKADVQKARLFMPGHFPDGGAIRLSQHGEVLGIAEGIETAFAASALFGVPCWAAGCDGALAAWLPPNDVAQIIIFADNDQNFAGQAAAYKLAHRLAVKERVVRVELPPVTGQDWNDQLGIKWSGSDIPPLAITVQTPRPVERTSAQACVAQACSGTERRRTEAIGWLG